MNVLASDFASLKDLEEFRDAKAKGWSDRAAFAVGDNGVGCWNDLTAQLHTPMCALPPERMIERWGSTDAARHKPVRVTIGCHGVVCILADKMPHLANIKNGCGIDLNPAAVAALGQATPLKTAATWDWV